MRPRPLHAWILIVADMSWVLSKVTRLGLVKMTGSVLFSLRTLTSGPIPCTCVLQYEDLGIGVSSNLNYIAQIRAFGVQAVP